MKTLGEEANHYYSCVFLFIQFHSWQHAVCCNFLIAAAGAALGLVLLHCLSDLGFLGLPFDLCYSLLFSLSQGFSFSEDHH